MVMIRWSQILCLFDTLFIIPSTFLQNSRGTNTLHLNNDFLLAYDVWVHKRLAQPESCVFSIVTLTICKGMPHISWNQCHLFFLSYLIFLSKLWSITVLCYVGLSVPGGILRNERDWYCVRKGGPCICQSSWVIRGWIWLLRHTQKKVTRPPLLSFWWSGG